MLKNAEHSLMIGERRKNEGTLWKAPGQKRNAAFLLGEAPTKKRKLVKKGKDVKITHSPKEFVPPPITYEGDVTIQEPVNPPPHSISNGPGHVAGLNHSGPSLLVAERLASYGEPTGGDGGRKLESTFWRAEPCRPCSGEGASFKEVAFGVQPKGSEVEMATGTPAVPVVVPNEGAPGETHPADNVEAPDLEEESPSNASSGGNPVDDAACNFASPFSYAELEEKLKQIPPDSTVVMPSAKMFEVVETLVSGLCGMAQQHDLFTDLLRTTDYMKAFVSQRKNSEDQLRLRLEEAEASLSTAREDNEALRAELAEAKSREESTVVRLHEAEDEMARLRGDREELEADYQKQVDDTFFFGYRCCMKNGIKWDVPSIPPGEEKMLLDKPAP
ncbi:hypothetical protein CK203_116289 [Vitis vinifera]|uniref:Uncharacterized protein n=1 Tax=Vitis vinifera TaxID=29760 RepID=A0A438C9H2_VITVI|nr:hypothetical protein CK203_116289 [Vitis vinifera]